MNKEEFLRAMMVIPFFGIFIWFFWFAPYTSQTLFIFLIVCGTILIIIIIFEAYLRIQHNIDSKLEQLRLKSEQKILESQKNILKELEKVQLVYEDSVDFMEVLMGYLEELKSKEDKK